MSMQTPLNPDGLDLRMYSDEQSESVSESHGLMKYLDHPFLNGRRRGVPETLSLKSRSRLRGEANSNRVAKKIKRTCFNLLSKIVDCYCLKRSGYKENKI